MIAATRRGLRIGLACLMAATAAAKVLGTHRANYLLPPWAYWIAIAVEVLSVVLLFSRAAFWGALIVAALSLGGAASAYLAPTRTCGCWGGLLHLSPAAHLYLAATSALAAGLLLLLLQATEQQGHDPGHA